VKGKAGPIPEIRSESEEAVDETTAETTPTDTAEDDRREPLTPQEYCCDEGDFAGSYEEWLEHSSATGLTGFTMQAPEPEQTALFETESRVTRYVNVAVTESWLNEARCNMERVVRQILSIEDEKKAFDADCNERLKPLKEQLRGLDKALQRTTEQREVECEWRVSSEENARVLVRLDTGERIDTKPLTEEDRVQELEAAQAVNEATGEIVTEDAAAAVS
jgi:hypothetical protein